MQGLQKPSFYIGCALASEDFLAIFYSTLPPPWHEAEIRGKFSSNSMCSQKLQPACSGRLNHKLRTLASKVTFRWNKPVIFESLEEDQVTGYMKIKRHPVKSRSNN